MKSLLLMRHAKSSWNDATLSDHDRPLNKRGERDAPRMARWLQSQDLLPDRIICSSARRTCQTAEVIAEAIDCEATVVDELYLANLQTWQAVLSANMDSEVLLAIGHNPGIEEFVEQVCGEYERMPTASIAWFTYPENVSKFEMGHFELQTIWRPKELDADQA